MITPRDLGNRLKKARRAKKWRTRDLHRLTKINEDYIKDFEDGKFNLLPKPYIRAFLRTIATTLGLDPEEILEEFEEVLNPPEVFEKAPAEKKVTSPKRVKSDAQEKILPEAQKGGKSAKENGKTGALEPERAKEEKSESSPKKSTAKEGTPALFPKRTHKTEVILSSLVVLILLAVGYVYWKYARHYFVSEKKPVKQITVFEARKEILAKEDRKNPPTRPKPAKTTAPKPKTQVSSKVTLALRAVDTTWVRLIRDTRDTSEFLFLPGNRRTFKGDSLLQLKMGRADGLLLWVNGDSVGTLGRAAQVVSKLVIDRKGIRVKKLRGPRRVPKPE